MKAAADLFMVEAAAGLFTVEAAAGGLFMVETAPGLFMVEAALGLFMVEAAAGLFMVEAAAGLFMVDKLVILLDRGALHVADEILFLSAALMSPGVSLPCCMHTSESTHTHTTSTVVGRTTAYLRL
jgi:hypothetical protein